MSPSTIPSRKRPREEEYTYDGNRPIVFSCSDLRPDTRLHVFDKTFHVHSLVLKLYSGYFRRFLDSADKVSVPPSSIVFRCDYVTVIDKDGMWVLEQVTKVFVSATPGAIQQISRTRGTSARRTWSTIGGTLGNSTHLCNTSDFRQATPTANDELPKIAGQVHV